MSGRPTRLDGDLDRLLSFTIPGRNVRGRTLRLGPVLDRILAAHDYPLPVQQLLAEALVLTALMGGLLKREGSQLTLQAQAEGGAVDLKVCDYRNGELRGRRQVWCGESSTPRRRCSGWRRLAGWSRARASPGSRWAAEWAG